MEQPCDQNNQPHSSTTTATTTTTTTTTTNSNTTLFDEGFENFFNNESLSDRILNIIETEKVSILFFSTIDQSTSIKQNTNNNDNNTF